MTQVGWYSPIEGYGYILLNGRGTRMYNRVGTKGFDGVMVGEGRVQWVGGVTRRGAEGRGPCSQGKGAE